MAEKPVIRYEVRAQRDPINNTTVYVPAIVDRSATKSLTTVIENAIDRGLIVGIKASAASGIATGLCEQLIKEFKDGNSVNFGGYFHGRLYLDGTVSGDGRITGANSVNIRLIKGVKWALAASDFSFMNIVDDKTPVVDFAISSAGAARGKLVKGQSVLVNGTTFGENAADVAVRFVYGDGAEATATVTGCGENLISVAWPDELSALPDGTEVSIVVIRTSGSATYVSTPRSAIVVG